MKAWVARGGVQILIKRNVVIIESMGGLPRGINVAKRNVVIIESMGWVAKGEGNVDKRNVKMLIKGM